MHYLIAYTSIFLGACLSCGLGIMVISHSSNLASITSLAPFAGTAAVLSALLLTKAYLYFLQKNQMGRLFLLSLAGILLANLLFGILFTCHIVFVTDNSPIIIKEFFGFVSLVTGISAVLGLVPNCLFMLGFNLAANHLQKRIHTQSMTTSI